MKTGSPDPVFLLHHLFHPTANLEIKRLLAMTGLH